MLHEIMCRYVLVCCALHTICARAHCTRCCVFVCCRDLSSVLRRAAWANATLDCIGYHKTTQYQRILDGTVESYTPDKIPGFPNATKIRWTPVTVSVKISSARGTHRPGSETRMKNGELKGGAWFVRSAVVCKVLSYAKCIVCKVLSCAK
jgi:hypothetical protein